VLAVAQDLGDARHRACIEQRRQKVVIQKVIDARPPKQTNIAKKRSSESHQWIGSGQCSPPCLCASQKETTSRSSERKNIAKNQHRRQTSGHQKVMAERPSMDSIWAMFATVPVCTNKKNNGPMSSPIKKKRFVAKTVESKEESQGSSLLW
jgi:hypothetical protein